MSRAWRLIRLAGGAAAVVAALFLVWLLQRPPPADPVILDACLLGAMADHATNVFIASGFVLDSPERVLGCKLWPYPAAEVSAEGPLLVARQTSDGLVWHDVVVELWGSPDARVHIAPTMDREQPPGTTTKRRLQFLASGPRVANTVFSGIIASTRWSFLANPFYDRANPAERYIRWWDRRHYSDHTSEVLWAGPMELTTSDDMRRYLARLRSVLGVPLEDEWGNPLRLSGGDSHQYLVSAGSDGTFGTADDLRARMGEEPYSLQSGPEWWDYPLLFMGVLRER